MVAGVAIITVVSPGNHAARSQPARPAPSPARPRGHPSATTIAALVNAGWLLVLNTLIAGAAVQRLAAGSHRIDGLPVLVISAIAAAATLAGAPILGSADAKPARSFCP